MWALSTENYQITMPITMIQLVEDDSDVAMYSVLQQNQETIPGAKTQI